MAKHVSRPENGNDEKNKQMRSLLRGLAALLLKIAVFAVVMILLLGYVFGLTRAAGTGMQPAFRDGDVVLFFRMAEEFAADEVVVVQYQGEKLLERVVATAGDTVDITEDGLIINDAILREPGAIGETTQFEEGITFPLTVPEGQVFVLGDNREHTTDSRIFGCVDTEDVYGRVIGLFRRREL